MKFKINCPRKIFKSLHEHLFQNELEQAAFLFSEAIATGSKTIFNIVESHTINPDDWSYQGELYLEMKDEIKSGIILAARKRGLAIIDCHSHPFATDDVFFSPTDRKGIAEFSRYVKWKNNNKPFCALVFGKNSFDGVGWYGDYNSPCIIEDFNIEGSQANLKASATWDKNFKKWDKQNEPL